MPKCQGTRTRRLRVESLESRFALDGNVAAYVSGANLVIVGDNLANEVAMFQLAAPVNGIPAGAYIVAGGTGGANSAATSATTINGAPYAVFMGPQTRSSDLYVDLRGGDDVMVLGNVANFNTDTNMSFSGVTNLLTGSNAPFAGAQTASLAIRDSVYIRMGMGEDVLGLDSLSVRRDLSIDMGYEWHNANGPNNGNGSSDEFVGIFNSQVGRNVWLASHQGSDSIVIGSTPNGPNNNQALSSDPFNTGRSIAGLTVGHILSIYTGAGDDDVRLNNVTASYVGVCLARGSDNLSMSNTSIRWLKVDGGYRDNAIDTISGSQANGVRVAKREVWNIENSLA